jgi:hypothetical protein
VRQAAHAGEQHEAHGDERGEADIVEQHDPEWRHARHERDRSHHQRENENGKETLLHGA